MMTKLLPTLFKRSERTGTLVSRSLIIIAVATVIAAPAAAGKYRDRNDYDNASYNGSNYNSSNYENATYDYARVVNVTPRLESYQVSNPVETCWNEQVPVRERTARTSRRKGSKTPLVLGAILGGVIGNQVGKRGGGKARDVATVAGAVLGGSIGRDVKHSDRRKYDRRNDRYETVGYESVKRCEVKESYVTKEQVVGYDVAYKYRGSVFHTQMDQDPGDKIKVKVTVDPV